MLLLQIVLPRKDPLSCYLRLAPRQEPRLYHTDGRTSIALVLLRDLRFEPYLQWGYELGTLTSFLFPARPQSFTNLPISGLLPRILARQWVEVLLR